MNRALLSAAALALGLLLALAFTDIGLISDLHVPRPGAQQSYRLGLLVGERAGEHGERVCRYLTSRNFHDHVLGSVGTARKSCPFLVWL